MQSKKVNSYIGIDYGSRRIGLSWGTDELKIAVPLNPIVNYRSMQQVLDTLAKLIKGKGADALVIGLPLHMDGQRGRRTKEVEMFATDLKENLMVPVYFVDERLSTQTAESYGLFKTTSARKQKQTKQAGIIDSRAAAIILQDFLDFLGQKQGQGSNYERQHTDNSIPEGEH